MHPVVAVTLGSNGFHLIELSEVDGKMKTTQHLYENVQAESFLNQDMCLDEKGAEAIIAAAGRFGKYLQDNTGSQVAAIATGTFRRAQNARRVLEQAGERLGVTIQVLRGRDESLLCYIGIASSAGLADHNRMVIDVGGGSTEIMIAQKNRLLDFASIDIGCVSLTREHFDGGEMGQSRFEQALNFTRQSFSPLAQRFSDLGWEEVMGCGGTVSSLFSVLQARRMGGRFITAAGLERFRHSVSDAGSPFSLCEGVVTRERASLLPAGSVILDAIYQEFGIEKLTPVFSSVAQGLLVELMKRQAQR